MTNLLNSILGRRAIKVFDPVEISPETRTQIPSAHPLPMQQQLPGKRSHLRKLGHNFSMRPGSPLPASTYNHTKSSGLIRRMRSKRQLGSAWANPLLQARPHL